MNITTTSIEEVIEEVSFKVERARAAQTYWEKLSFTKRKKVLNIFAEGISNHCDELTNTVLNETGKKEVDTLLEIALSVTHLRWSARNARRYLRWKWRRSNFLTANNIASVIWKPYGVVGVIGPWNYPIFTPMGSISSALAAGNAVIFKPSPYSEAIGKKLVEIWEKSFAKENYLYLFQFLPGDNQYGIELSKAKINKLSFTGSSKTGRAVMKTAAENLTPVVIEAGGMDPVFVAADANIAKAITAITWSAMSNSGQTCIGATRIYVESPIYDNFKVGLIQQIANIDPILNGDYGPMVLPGAPQQIEGQVNNILGKDLRIIFQKQIPINDKNATNYLYPIILESTDPNYDIPEEIFGPVVVLCKVESITNAIAHLQNSNFGLGASIWSKGQGKKLVPQIKAGMISINSVNTYAGASLLPFGGVGDSGFGRIHGIEGLKEFSYPVAVSKQIFSLPFELTSFGKTKTKISIFKKIIKTLNI